MKQTLREVQNKKNVFLCYTLHSFVSLGPKLENGIAVFLKFYCVTLNKEGGGGYVIFQLGVKPTTFYVNCFNLHFFFFHSYFHVIFSLLTSVIFLC